MEGREGYGKKKPGLSSEDRVFLFPAGRQGSISILSMSGTFEKVASNLSVHSNTSHCRLDIRILLSPNNG